MMNKFVLGVLFSVILTFGSVNSVQASDFHVSPNGNDLSNGSASTPFKTLTKAVSVLMPGDSLTVNGTFNETFNINKSGSATARIRIIGNQSVIDTTGIFGITISGSYIDISGFEVKNVRSHGFHVTGQHINVSNVIVHNSVLENIGRSTGSGWGSAFSIKLGSDDVNLRNITAYKNYGEAMAITRAKNVTVKDSLFYDNYSSNGPYIDNSINVLIDKNFSFCTPNSGFERSGVPGNGILIGEEFYTGWGSQLANVKITNNIIYNCKGIGFWGSSVGGGLRGALIAHNTIYGLRGSTNAVSIAQDSANANIQIVNNIAVGGITTGSGITASNNIQTDPMFLTSPTNSVNSFKLAANSPAIGAGRNISINYDFFGAARGPRYDAGAVQYAGVAISNPPIKIADVNLDGVVNIIDIGVIIDNYGKNPIPNIRADVDKNGTVNIIDIGIAIDNYLK